MRKHRQWTLLALAAASLGLTACGGGNSSSAAPSSESSATPSSEPSSQTPSSSSEEPSSQPSSEVSSSEESSTSTLPEFDPVECDYTPVHPESWGLKLRQPTNALADDFAYGVDCSSVLEVEKGGGKYYVNEGGKWVEKELFRAMRDGGATHARIRLWVDPYDKEGNRYGGGTNDLASDIEIATRAQKAGLKVLLDFHYSDSWVDPGKYYAPKSWADVDLNDRGALVYDYTKETLEAFYKAGIEVHSVQIGNEINPGIAGVPSSNYTRLAKLIKNGMTAAKEIYPNVKTIVHYTNITSYANLFKWAGTLQKAKALPDIFGVSYYPYWHGSLDNLQFVLDKFATDYGTEVQVVETSWGYTDEWADYCHNQYSSSTYGEVGGYETSPQGQASTLANIIDVLSKVPEKKGTGIYYWEPAWLPNQYSGWITKEGAYYNDTGRDWTDKLTREQLNEKYADDYAYSSWANQALFGYDGHALDSLYTYYHMAKGDSFVQEQVTTLAKTEFDMTVNLAEEWELPKTVRAYTNLGASTDVPVTWSQEDLDMITGAGYYVIHGLAIGQQVTLNLKAAANFVKDPGFEAQKCSSGAEKKFTDDPWYLTTTNGYKVDQGDAWIEAKGEIGGAGNNYLHWYTASTPLEFTLTQDLGRVLPGNYEFGFSTHSSWKDGGDKKAGYDDFKIVITVDGEPKEYDCRDYCTEEDVLGQQVGILAFDKEVSVTLSFVVKTSSGGAWGNADDFFFSAIIDE